MVKVVSFEFYLIETCYDGANANRIEKRRASTDNAGINTPDKAECNHHGNRVFPGFGRKQP